MGETFQKSRQVIKKVDPELVSLGLSGAVIGIVTYKPEYVDQMIAIFETLKSLVTDEKITEDTLHQEIQKALEDIGVDDPDAQLAIKLFLVKLDRLAEKYLDVDEGFTQEERAAWKQVFDDLVTTLRLFKASKQKGGK